VTLSAASIATYNSAHSSATVNAASLSAADVAAVVNSQITGATASVVGGALTFTSSSTGTSSNVVTSAVTTAGAATGSTGVTSATGTAGAAAVPPTSALGGLTLDIAATGGGTATSITFGDGTGGTVKTLNQLNAALASNNLQASISTDGKITITTSNDAASSTIGAITGTATGAGKAFVQRCSGWAPVARYQLLSRLANLVSQYNNIIHQITTTAQDASFNGVNLLAGDSSS
jgi:flagellin